MKKNFVSCFDIREVPRSPGKWNWDLLSFFPFIFIFEHCVKDPKYKPNWLTRKILDQNGLQGEFRNSKIDRKPKDGVYLSFEPITPELIERLNSMTRLDCFLGNPLIEKRVRKERTEMELLKLLEMCTVHNHK